MRKAKQKRSVIVRLLVIGVCVYMTATLASLWRTLSDSKAKLAELQARYVSEQYEIDELKTLLESDSDSKIIEKAARERLGYVYTDEQIYVDISGN